jgi:predicted MFS family arabinose efflux permease
VYWAFLSPLFILAWRSVPFFGGFLTQSFGWRSIFSVSAVLGVIVTAITHRFLGNDDKKENKKHKPLKLKGLAFYIFGLTALVFGSSAIPKLHGWLLILTSIISLMAFWQTESRSSEPVIDIHLYTQNRLFTFSNLAALINYSATFAIVFFLSFYLQKIQQFTPRKAGLILVAQPAIMAAFSPLAGRLSDKIQPRYLATLGMTVCTTGLAAFAFLEETTPVLLIVSLLIWEGLGFAFFSSPNMNTIMSSVDKSKYGVASGSAATMRVIGQIFSMTIATFFFALLFGGNKVENVSNELFLDAMQYGFIIFTVIAVSGIYFSYYRGIIKRD